MLNRPIHNSIWLMSSLFILAAFLNVPVYYSMLSNPLVANIIQLGLIGIGVIYWALYARKNTYPVRYWLTFLVIVLLVSFSHAVMNDEYSTDAVKAISIGFAFIVPLSLMFVAASSVGRDARWLFFFGALLASILNVVDFFDQGALFEQIDGFGVRAAAFYVNANRSAEAILLGMVLGIGVLEKKYRLLFCFTCLIGVALTLSRGGLITWFLILLVMGYYGIFSLRAVVLISGLAGFGLSFLYVGADFVSDYVNIDLLLARIEFFSGDGAASQVSQDDRLVLAEKAWSLFLESPLFGMGDYALLRRGAGQLAHNQYLHLLSDLGVIGLFSYFLLLFSVVSFDGKNGAHRVFLFFILVWGFFSHSILDGYAFWIAFSYIGVSKVLFRPSTGAALPVAEVRQSSLKGLGTT